jgi:ubiquinone/menaquinone biosynthesis C-methylase UbiE
MNKEFWNSLARMNRTTGTRDYVVAAFDQRMRLKCLEIILSDYKELFTHQVNLLDFGCGSGDFILHFSNRFNRLIGYDISEDILSIAQQRTKDFSNIILANSLDSLSLRFDLVFSITVLQHILDDDELTDTLSRIAGLCNEHAYFVALESFDTKEFPITQPAHVKARTSDQWRRIFDKAGFDLLETRSFYNPYLIKTNSFTQYWRKVKWFRLFYRLFCKLHLSTAFLEYPITRCIDGVLSTNKNIDGFVDIDSFSKFIICQKR